MKTIFRLLERIKGSKGERKTRERGHEMQQWNFARLAKTQSVQEDHRFTAFARHSECRERSERHRNLKVFLRVPRERCNHAKQRRAKQHCTDHTERDATPQIGESLA